MAPLGNEDKLARRLSSGTDERSDRDDSPGAPRERASRHGPGRQRGADFQRPSRARFAVVLDDPEDEQNVGVAVVVDQDLNPQEQAPSGEAASRGSLDPIWAALREKLREQQYRKVPAAAAEEIQIKIAIVHKRCLTVGLVAQTPRP